MGAEMTFARDPAQTRQAYFGVKEPQPKSIRAYTTEHRTYRKKIVTEGRATEWKMQPGRQREEAGILRTKKRMQPGIRGERII